MKVNTEEITAVLKELHNITGFRISLHGANYEEIAAYPADNLDFCKMIRNREDELSKCIACDSAACKIASDTKSTYIYTCHRGLVEAVSPLYDFDTLTGYLMMGQVLASECDEQTQKFRSSNGANNIKIPTISPNMVNSCVHIMTICAKYLTLSNAVKPENATLAALAKNYIHENIGKKITIADICSDLRCSKTSLLTSFKKEHGVTVNSYITEQKLCLAEKMLTSTKSISEVSRLAGFSDQSYFSKVFSAKHGIPPSEYCSAVRNAKTDKENEDI